MATATIKATGSKASKATGSKAQRAAAALAPESNGNGYPGALPPAAPPENLQHVVAAAAAPAPPPATEGAGDPNTIEFLAIVNQLDTMIRAQSADRVAYYAARGALVAHGIDIKVAKARNEAHRRTLRAAAVRAMELTALGAYDPESEPQPKLDRWLYLHWLCTLYPTARNLKTVAVAVKLATLLTRVELPPRFSDPESFEPKRGRADILSALVDRAVRESLTLDDLTTAMAEIDGASAESESKRKESDPVESAKQLAVKTVGRVRDGSIDPATYVDALLAELARFGYILAPGRDGKGAESLKLVKAK